MLQLIIGRSGYGKTEYVFNSIKKSVKEKNEDVILVTPEQFSFAAERRLLRDLGEDGIRHTQNVSFTRLSQEIKRIYGSEKLPVISGGAKAVMMKKAIESVSDGLRLFKNNIYSNSFITSIVSVYDELKSCRVSDADIIEAASSCGKKNLSDKLNDIADITAAYEALIDGKFTDSADELKNLYEKLCKVNYFTGKTVFIDGFNGFVAQEYKILEVILKQSSKVFITFCTDSDVNTYKYDVFAEVNRNIAILKNVCKKEKVVVLPSVYLDKAYRYKNNELAFAEKNIFSTVKKTYDSKCNSIFLYKADNVYDECDCVARQISKLLRNGMKASEISVICRDASLYQTELGFAFNKYEIPFFDDKRQNINSQPIIMFVNFLLRSVIYSYRSDDIFSMLKTGMTGLENEDINKLENYAFMWNINGSDWKREFVNSTKGFSEKITSADAAAIKALNKSREYVVDKISRFSNSSKGKSCFEICKALYFTLIDFGCDKSLRQLAVTLDNGSNSAAAAELGRVWDMLMDILTKLNAICGSQNMTLSEFYDLFALMIQNEDMGTIPAGLDNVQFGCADRIRCDNPRAVFILGANEGEFPQNLNTSGLLTEQDRKQLIDSDFKLYSYGDVFLAQEKYFAYMALFAAREKLYVSYKSSVPASSIVTEIKSVFPLLTESHSGSKTDIDYLCSRENAFEILSESFCDNTVFINSLKKYFLQCGEYSNRLTAVKNLCDNEIIKIKDKDASVSLFGKNMYLSASKIEEYYKCPFRYFCKFGIKAKPRTKAQMDAMQTGTVIHYVLENIIREQGTQKLKTLDNEEAQNLVQKYLSLYFNTKLGETQRLGERFKYLFMRLSKMLCEVILRLRDEFLQSDFTASAFELKIGDMTDGEDIKSPVITLDDGGTVTIKGSVDRVDTYEENGSTYVRVIDYKSGSKTFSLSDVMYGLNLQMFVYLFIVCSGEYYKNAVASGVLYMHSARDVINIDNSLDVSELKKKENASFKMKGIILNDDENPMAIHMEKSLEGKYIPAKFSKRSNCVTGDIATLEDFGRISKKVTELIKDMGESLHSGDIGRNPADGDDHDKTCEYCDYRDVCMNSSSVESRKIISYNTDECLELFRKDEQDA